MNLKNAFDKSLFLFGAGSSYNAGCKMSKDMLEDLLKEITNEASNRYFNNVQKDALKFLLSCLEYHNKWRSLETNNKFSFSPNIEELALLIRRVKNRENFLPYPVTGNWADKLISLEADFSKSSDSNETLFGSLDRIIKSELLPKWLGLDNNNLDFLNPLKEVFEIPKQNFEMELFTLNNDMVIETFFDSHNMSPWRGFVSNTWCGMDDEKINHEYGRINLYKLHGSLDWVRLNTGEAKIRTELLEEPEIESIDENHSPYVIFGHGVKTFSVDPFFNLIHNFKKTLSERDYFFIVGYSFFDPYVNNLLIEALNGGNKKMIIINPSFGPDHIQNQSQKNDGDFFEALDVNGISFGNDLVEYIEAIQQNPFYSEMPEFNMKVINGESPLFYIKKGTEEFLNHFFRNDGAEFLKLVEKFEDEQRMNLPF